MFVGHAAVIFKCACYRCVWVRCLGNYIQLLTLNYFEPEKGSSNDDKTSPSGGGVDDNGSSDGHFKSYPALVQVKSLILTTWRIIIIKYSLVLINSNNTTTETIINNKSPKWTQSWSRKSQLSYLRKFLTDNHGADLSRYK